ncbi:FHA domain-containing protein [Corallococcus aberystwythensis]|uniref:FHA domain-containing protein n=1 Tax=Corallococcus aberystwythensis TaxID=2316722 RepID=A0A3A8PW92_9BACT|nr:FHA domain-containing protein [Corallococcus aberystwythensis]RKH59300.1 FHA domain-containing protein [Corallococcus aberystwythensis]
MAPPNPKRPPRPPRPPGQKASSDDPDELPFDDDEVAPLQADDPRPQRVPQYPAGPRKVKRRGPGERTKSDRELSPRYDWAKEYSDPGVTPAFVYVERGPGAGQLVPLHQGSITLGRSSTSDLRLQHASISRRHAQLTRRGNVFTVRDLGSQNGTFVNRLRIKGEVEIKPGDELSLGNATLRLRGSGAGPAVPRTLLDPLPRPGKRPLSGVAVAVAAVVVGSVVAALISGVAMRMADGAPTKAPGAPAAPANDAAAELPAKVPDVSPQQDAPLSATDVARGLHPATPTPDGSTGASKGLSASDIARGAHASRAPASAPDLAHGPPASTGQAAAAAGRKDHPSAEPPGPPDERQRAGILSRYESGDVAGALAQAKRANLAPLVQQLTRFQAAESAARTALAQQDRPRALDALGAAVRADQELSQGWSRQGLSLRRQLAGLYVRTGQEAARAQRFAEARTAFTAALQYDAENAEARTQLAALAAQAP